MSPFNSAYRLHSFEARVFELTSDRDATKTVSEKRLEKRGSDFNFSIYWGAHNKSKHFEVLNISPKQLSLSKRQTIRGRSFFCHSHNGGAYFIAKILNIIDYLSLLLRNPHLQNCN